MFHFFLLINRQGKMRLNKWWSPYTQKEQSKIGREITQKVLNRTPKQCNFIEWREFKIIYRRYASVYFVFCIDKTDNELISLEVMHFFCVVLDKHFGNVCELDLIFNFDKVYVILDECILSGEQQETSSKEVIRRVNESDTLARAEVLEEALAWAY
mmetsp:Transcript_24484/g.27231  ORF Transcript_24484/g.27231 Transcript_24484/m.27231 type:complete len:156 (+) Transcript_24484:50-517(+)